MVPLESSEEFCANCGASEICAVDAGFRNRSGCDHGECRREVDEYNLYADDLVLMNENMEHLREKFLKWRRTFESRGLKVNLGRTKKMVRGLKEEIVKGKVDPCAK